MWKEAEKFLLKDKYVGPFIKRYGHCSLKPRSKKYYFEDLVDAIVQQQLSMTAATAIFNRIKKKISDKNDSSKERKHKWRSGKTYQINVTPEKILALSDTEFRECGLSQAKIAYVRDLSEKVLANKLQMSKLDKLSDQEIMNKLVEIKGIGVWTAHMFLMFTLGRADIFPVGDLGLRNAFKKVIKEDLDIKEMEKFASAHWKPYRTVASWYIWRSLEGS